MIFLSSFRCAIADNRTENVNPIIKETLQKLRIDHFTTSFHQRQISFRVESLHRTLHDLLTKNVLYNNRYCALYLNPTLGAIRLNENKTTKFSPFKLIYDRDLVLPVDNILQRRRHYNGEGLHQIAFQERHKAFVRIKANVSKDKRKQQEYAENKCKEISFEIEEQVYLKNQCRRHKLDKKVEAILYSYRKYRIGFISN